MSITNPIHFWLLIATIVFVSGCGGYAIAWGQYAIYKDLCNIYRTLYRGK